MSWDTAIYIIKKIQQMFTGVKDEADELIEKMQTVVDDFENGTPWGTF